MTIKNDPRWLANMRENCKRDIGWFIGMKKHCREFIPVLGGPSLKTRIREVKARQRIGGCIVAGNGAARFLFDNGIIPDFIVFVDPSSACVGFIDKRLTKPIYLVGSTCDPSVLDALGGFNVWLWHPNCEDIEQEKILDAYPGKPSILIGGGSTVGLRMLSLGYMLGFRRFHFYGLDSSYADDGEDHAYKKHDGPEDAEVREALFEGKKYRGSGWMIKQAGEFLDDQYPKFRNMGCTIFVHGSGLIPDMVKYLHLYEGRQAA